MKFDVIIPSYNGSKYLKDTVESVLAQTYPDFGITIIDDLSTDNTRQIISELVRKNEDRVSAIYSTEKRRAAGSRMKAIAETNGDLIAFVDQDDLWHPEKLRFQYEFFRKGFDVVHTDIDAIDEFGQIISGQTDIENDRRYELFSNPDKKQIVADLCEENCIRITSSAITRSAFQKIGGFDVDLFGGEDWEFWFRAVVEGLSVKHINKKLTYKRTHTENTSKVFRLERNQGLLMACDKSLKKYPFMSVHIQKRTYLILKRMIVNLMMANKSRDAFNVMEDTLRLNQELLTFPQRSLLFMYILTGSVGRFITKSKRKYFNKT